MYVLVATIAISEMVSVSKSINRSHLPNVIFKGQVVFKGASELPLNIDLEKLSMKTLYF